MKHRKHIIGSIVLVSNEWVQYPLRITSVEPQVSGIRQYPREDQYDLFRDRPDKVETMVAESDIVEILRF